MSYNFGHAGDLQNSLPCYASEPLRWRSALANRYTQRNNTDYYNFREQVPWDRHWGRSDVACWATGHVPPFNVVDLGSGTPQYYIEALPSDYRFLPYFDELPVTPWQPPGLGRL